MFKGLSQVEASEKLKTHGLNELPSAKPKNILKIALEVMKEPMFILLISCGILYMVLGDYREGAILSSTIFIIIFITFYQYQKTEKALEALKKLSSPRALVIRDGVEVRVPSRELVPEDVIILHEGDRIPADATLLETMNLIVDESLLTGESVPVIKSVGLNENEPTGMVFSGTLVVQGRGFAKVTATGSKTQFGKIGTSLQQIKSEPTRLQKEMKMLIKNLFIIGGLISIGVVIAFYLTRGHFIQSLLNGLAASIAILPEEFPVVLTVFLALGAWRLSKNNVLTRNPSAIETLGSATVLCTDKTGTITQNRMEIATIFHKEKTYYKRALPENVQQYSELVKAAFYACQKDSIDPMEKAIVHHFQQAGLDSNTPCKLIHEYPLSKKLFAITRLIAHTPRDYSAYAKGAPEAIFKLCKLNPKELMHHMSHVIEMAQNGYRVIAVATATWDGKKLPDTQSDFNFTCMGLIGFEDPIRPEVPKAIRECNKAGVKVIMITGDFPLTAKSIAREIGMKTNMEILTGVEMDAMNDAELKRRIKTVNIFARVIPEQKLRIVQALKENNEIVAMTGDGVNDAPALKAANIGIAMGNKGTDVAREASSLVLLDDNFASIVAAIRSGRRIFDNLQKAMSYIIAIHIPIIGLTLLPAFFTSLPIFLMPLHIVFMELIIDPVCSIAFESEQEEKGIMKRPPRNPDKVFFGRRKIGISALEGLLLMAVVLILYFLSLKEGHSIGEVRAIAFSSLIIGNIFLALTSMSKTRSFLSVIIEGNITVIVILLVAFLMLVLILMLPSLLHIFSFEFTSFKHFYPSLIGSFVMLLILETVKYIRITQRVN